MTSRSLASAPTFPPLRPFGPPPHEWGGVKCLLPFGQEVVAQAANLGVDALEIGFVGLSETRRVDRVRPHHDRVFAVVGVVALAAPDHLETEALVYLHRVLIRRADLERDPFGAHVVCRLHQPGENDPPVAAML